MEQVFISSIAHYFTKLGIFDKYNPFIDFPDLASFPFFKKHQVDAYLKKHYILTEKEYVEFLSFSLEIIILTSSEDHKEVHRFLDEFGSYMNDTLINRAVINAMCLKNIEDRQTVDDLLKM
ncbi:MAG: hypothetical protein Q7J14_01015, partial [Candidatus Magasanikbacteria bacterium]|nr:hypothetical protein [Candidatus Magasanikbacteria bacterium]